MTGKDPSHNHGESGCSSLNFVPIRIKNYNDMLKITVGKDGDRKVFRVYREILESSSGYFQMAFKPQWAPDNKISLESWNPETFEIFISFASRGILDNLTSGMMSEFAEYGNERIIVGIWDKEHDFLKKFKDLFKKLIDLWIFGDYIIVPTFQDAVMNMITDTVYQMQAYPRIPSVPQYIYANTTEGSPLRKFYSRMVALCEKPENLAKTIRIVGDVDFAVDIVEMQRLKITALESRQSFCDDALGFAQYLKLNPCAFHVHRYKNDGASSGQEKLVDV